MQRRNINASITREGHLKTNTCLKTKAHWSWNVKTSCLAGVVRIFQHYFHLYGFRSLCLIEYFDGTGHFVHIDHLRKRPRVPPQTAWRGFGMVQSIRKLRMEEAHATKFRKSTYLSPKKWQAWNYESQRSSSDSSKNHKHQPRHRHVHQDSDLHQFTEKR